jgi:hypothetical protein
VTNRPRPACNNNRKTSPDSGSVGFGDSGLDNKKACTTKRPGAITRPGPILHVIFPQWHDSRGLSIPSPIDGAPACTAELGERSSCARQLRRISSIRRRDAQSRVGRKSDVDQPRRDGWSAGFSIEKRRQHQPASSSRGARSILRASRRMRPGRCRGRLGGAATRGHGSRRPPSLRCGGHLTMRAEEGCNKISRFLIRRPALAGRLEGCGPGGAARAVMVRDAQALPALLTMRGTA